MISTYLRNNEYYIENNVLHVVLENKYGETVGIAKASLFDEEILRKVRWRKNAHGYAVGYFNKKLVQMHRYLLGTPKGMATDHINHEKLDNRRENIRICSYHENGMNRKKEVGIHFRQDRSKWVAKIMIDYKTIHIGHFDTKEEALKARKEAERCLL